MMNATVKTAAEFFEFVEQVYVDKVQQGKIPESPETLATMITSGARKVREDNEPLYNEIMEELSHA